MSPKSQPNCGKPRKCASAAELRRAVEDALVDPTPSVPAREVFRRLSDRHAAASAAGASEPE